MSNAKYRYKDIDDLLTGRLRLAIMAFLMTAEKSDFSEILKITEATKGNLGAQIQRLEEAKYISVKKGYLGKRSHMSVNITKRGRAAFYEHLETLQRMVNGEPKL
ncbi:MAG: transcriptional regulator [Litorimonas sp.]